MITFPELEKRFEPFNGPQYDEVRPSAADLQGYRLRHLDRDNGILYEAFHHLDGKGPKGSLRELCARQKTVSVLDAGCGTGNQLVSLIIQTAIIEDIDPERIFGDAVSDYDFSKLSRDRLTRVAIGAGLVNYAVLDLATYRLPPQSYDLAYSYEVLMHNERPGVIIDNIAQSLKPGGVAYFNTDGSQVGQVDAHMEQYRQAGAEVLSGEINPPAYAWFPPELAGETRHAFKVTAPAP